MNGIKIIVFILLSCIAASSSFADIYEWTDENGVKHFSNYAHPAQSKILMRTKETPYDEAADRARMEIERQERLDFDRQEIVQREIELELREAEAERRIAEADRIAEAALDEVDYLQEETRPNSWINFGSGDYWCFDGRYGCQYPIYNRWYYRKNHRRHHPKKLTRLSPYQSYRYIKRHYGPEGNKQNHKYHEMTHQRKNGNYSSVELNFRGTKILRGNRMGIRNGGFNGRSNISRRGFGPRMRR